MIGEERLCPMADQKAIGRELSCRLDQLGPGKFTGAVLLQGKGHSGHSPGNTGGAITEERRILALNQLAIWSDKHVARRRGRRRLAIINRNGSSVAPPDHHEATAAEVTRSWIDN